MFVVLCTKGAFIYDVRCFLGIFDLPTYPNQMVYYIGLFSKIRCSLTYLPTQKSDVIYECSLMYLLTKNSTEQGSSKRACVRNFKLHVMPFYSKDLWASNRMVHGLLINKSVDGATCNVLKF